MRRIRVFPSSFSPSEKALVILQSLYFFTGSLGGIFLNIYIYKIGGFASTILLNLNAFLFLIVFFILSGYLLKNYKTNNLMQFSFLIYIFVWLSVFLLKDNSYKYVIPIGIAYGVGLGLFWSSFNLIQYIETHTAGRNKYFGILNTYINILRAVGPIIGGILVYIGNILIPINDAGYLILFAVVIILNIINYFYANNLPSYSGVKFKIKSLVGHNKSKVWNGVLIEQFIIGLFDVSFGTVSGILFYLIFVREDYLGYFTAFMLGISAISSLLGSRLPLEKRRYFIGATVISATGVLYFAFNQNLTGAVMLGILSGIGSSFYTIVLSRHILDGIDTIGGLWQDKYHVFVERDFALGISRVFSYLFLYILFNKNNSVQVALNWIKYLPILILILGIAMAYTSKKMRQKKY